MLEKILLNKLTLIVAVAAHPRLFHRPNFPVVLPLPLEDLLDLPSGGVSDTASSGLAVWRMRLVDDLLFDLSLALKHAVVSFCCGNAA